MPISKSYIHPHIEVLDSPIEGKGLFATRAIPANTILCITAGRYISLEEFHALPAEHKHLCFFTADNTLLAPLDFNNLDADWYMNHSCNANAGCFSQTNDICIAMRDILAGEEITYDYCMTESEELKPMQCECGAKKCRKLITGEDWKQKDLQKRYAGYFQKNIQDKINKLQKTKK